MLHSFFETRCRAYVVNVVTTLTADIYIYIFLAFKLIQVQRAGLSQMLYLSNGQQQTIMSTI